MLLVYGDVPMAWVGSEISADGFFQKANFH